MCSAATPCRSNHVRASATATLNWPTEWQVGNNEYGIRRFFERASDVLSALDEPTKDLMLSLIDPDNTEEPLSRCRLVPSSPIDKTQGHPVHF